LYFFCVFELILSILIIFHHISFVFSSATDGDFKLFEKFLIKKQGAKSKK